MSGSLSFAAGSHYGYSAGFSTNFLSIADLDRDGKPDLVTSGSSGNYYTWFIVARNASTPGTISFTSAYSGGGYIAYAPVIGDLNGDGKPELIVPSDSGDNASTDSTLLSIYVNTSIAGSISFPYGNTVSVGRNAGGIRIVDLNGDGKSELLIASTRTLLATVYRNETVCSACTAPTFVNNGLIILDASCGNNDGQISIIPTSGSAPFMYSIDGGATYKSGANTGSGFTNLAPGTYKLRLKDANGCESAIVERTIRSIYGGPTFTYNTTPATFNNNGSISITPISGTGPFSYSFDAGTTYVAGSATGYTFNNLAANTYYLRIKSAAGCESVIIYVAVSKNIATGNQGCTPPTFKNDGTIVLDASCGNNDGQISIIPTTGTAPFMYSIDGGATYKTGANTGAGFTNLAPGTYKLRLKDANGCESAIVERTIRSSYGGPSFTYKTTEASCGNRNGSIAIIPSGGAGSFMYSIDGGMTYVEGPSTGYTFSNLAANTYYLRVKNAAGCESVIIYEAVKGNFSNCTGATVQANITALQMAISPEVINTDAIKAHPNPTKGPFKLQVKVFTSSIAEVSIFNAEGKLVQKRQLNLAVTNTVDFDLTGQAKGMYYIKITSNSGTKTSKVLVQ